MNFEKYIGIPYLEKGRDTAGLDCWGLVRLIYKEVYNIDLPSFQDSYVLEDDERIAELFAQYKEGWQPVETPVCGDLVLFRILGVTQHVGVMINNTQFVHVRQNSNSAVESVANAKWAKRVVGFYKYVEQTGVVLNAVPHPLKTTRITQYIAPGTNLEELFELVNTQNNIAPELCKTAVIMVNGVPVPRVAWGVTVINPTDTVEYRALAGKDLVRTVAFIALAWYAPTIAVNMLGTTVAGTVGALTFTGTVAAAAVVLAGSALINAIAPIRPPAEPKDPGSSERQLMVTGGSNQLNPYGAIPVVLGRVRLTPPLGSVNYLTYENERDSYLSMLLVWGYGPLVIDNNSYRIGNVPLTNFDQVTKVDLDRIVEGNTLQNLQFNAIYGKDTNQINPQLELVCDGNPESSVSPGPPYEAGVGEEYDPEGGPVPVVSTTIAIHFPQGLRGIWVKGPNAGDSFAVGVTFNLAYSTNNGDSWVPLDPIIVGGDAPKRDGFTFTKTYSNQNFNKLLIRIQRVTGDNTEDSPDKRYYFSSVLQSITFLRNSKPAVDPVGAKIAKTAIKIKASEQLGGSIQGVNAVVQTYCKTWNGTSWVNGPTSNPAALMRYVLEHPANPRRVTNASNQIDLPALQAFHVYCQNRGFEYNSVLAGQPRSILEVLRDICAAGRASPALVNGKWSVVIDEEKTITVNGQQVPLIIQHFTPHNSWGFEGVKALPKRPDGLRITYYDQDRDYQESEIIVYDIGKNSVNSSLFESIVLPGVTKKSLVIDHARWHLAQIKLRPEVYTLNCDIEYLVCNRGDRVKVMHDVPMWGLGSGRIKARTSDTVLVLDEELAMVANTNYTVRFRSKTGGSVTRTVVPKIEDGYYNTITLTSSVTTTDADIGDLFLFGSLNQESQDLLVLKIEPTTNNNARITLVDYGVTNSYNIFSDYQTLSETTVFESQITLPPALQIQSFGTKSPQITGFVSDESVMERVSRGIFKYKINVSYINQSNLPQNTEAVQVQYNLQSDLGDLNSKVVQVPFYSGSANILDVSQGESYKIRMRYASKDGVIVGPWSSYGNHTVVGKITPPGAVTGFAVTSDKSSGQLLLTWNESPEPDTYTYEIRTQNVNWGSNDSFRVFYGDSTRTNTYTPTSTTTYFIRAVDSSGNYSTSSASFTYTTQSVPNTAELRHVFADTALTNATVLLEWDTVNTSEFGVSYYEVTYDSTVKTTNSNSIILPADWVGDRTFTVKTVDILGKKSSGYVGAVTKLAPNSPQNVKSQVVDNNVMLYWTLPARTSLPIDHILIKRGNVWSTATVLGEKKGEFTSISEIKGGTFTYWLACVDTEGVQSDPTSIIVTVSEPPDFVFNGEQISNFSGTKVNSAFDGTSQLVLPVNTTETYEQHFTTRNWASPQSQVNSGFPIFIQPSETSGYYEQVFDFVQPLASSRITLTYLGTVISGTPVVTNTISVSLNGSTYTDYVGVSQIFANQFQYVKVRVNVSGTGNTTLYALSDLKVSLDAKLKDDAGRVEALEGPASGTVVNFNKEFIDVQSITLSPSGLVGGVITPLYAVYDFKDVFQTGTYSVVSNVCTVTFTNHGFITGQKIKLFANSGLGLGGIYTVTSYTTNTFSVAMTVGNTSGGMSFYPQSFRVYLYNNSGTRASSDVSWSIKGY
jgi:hypothetical protein